MFWKRGALRQEEGDEIIDSGSAHICAFSLRPPPRLLLFSSLGTKQGVCLFVCVCVCHNGETQEIREHIRTSVDDGESARGWRRSEKVGEGVVEIAGLDGAPARDAGVLVGRLDDFGFRGRLVGFVVVFFSFGACWRAPREGIALRHALPTSSSPSPSAS